MLCLITCPSKKELPSTGFWHFASCTLNCRRKVQELATTPCAVSHGAVTTQSAFVIYAAPTETAKKRWSGHAHARGAEVCGHHLSARTLLHALQYWVPVANSNNRVCASKFFISVVFADVPLQCACVFVVNKNRDIYSIEIYKRFKILNQRARRAIHCEHLAM